MQSDRTDARVVPHERSQVDPVDAAVTERDQPNAAASFTRDRSDDIAIHVFTVSATLVGVCLTVIGLFRTVGRLRGIISLADNILSLNAIVFLASCIAAYTALRTRESHLRRRRERIADMLFLTALAMMTVTCAVIALELV